MAFQKAQRSRAFVKIALTGPSGSGKTVGALLIAFGFAKGGKIAVIDTEHHRSELYSDMGDYDVCGIEAPFHSNKYVQAINDAVDGGYEVLIIDSTSHQWAGDGGILSRKEQEDSRGGNPFTNWAKFTPEHETFKAAINDAPIHIIATMRSKQDFVMSDNGKGRSAPQKVGLAPIQREGMEYEYASVFDIAINHEAAVSKDNTGLFDGIVGRIDQNVGTKIRAWWESGADPIKPVASAPAKPNGSGLTRIAPTLGDIQEMAASKGKKPSDLEAAAKKWGFTSTLQLDDAALCKMWDYLNGLKAPKQETFEEVATNLDLTAPTGENGAKH